MAFPRLSHDFDLDDHGILRDSFALDFHVDDEGILHDNLDLFKHAASTGGHGTDSGIGADKQSSTSTHLHASFDEDLAPLGDESINISDFEASRDDLDSFDGDVGGGRRSRASRGARELETPGSTLERPVDYRSGAFKASGRGRVRQNVGEDQDLFSEDYYRQLRELGVLVDGADFSRDGSQTEFEALESHLSRDHGDFDDNDNRDLIGEYLQNEYERERAEEEEEEEGEDTDEKGGRSQSHIGPSSRANSAPTISEQSFPEISPEDAEMMYHGSQRTREDEEIYRISHHRGHSSAMRTHQEHPDTTSEHEYGPDSQGNDSQIPRAADRHWSSRSPSPEGSEHQGYSRSETNTPRKMRPDSVASHVSFASDMVQHAGDSGHGKALAKAHSQESFFEQESRQPSKSADKMPKRMLPTPSAPNTSQSFRVKSKSVGNVSGRAVPVKPTHRSLSEAGHLDHSGTATEGMSTSAGDTTHDRSDGELSTQLKQESSKRKQATELVQQLQKEYDSLLSKYALAELTIDQMRLGAHITLHADSPTPAAMQASAAPPGGGGQKPQVMQLPTPSAQRAVTGQFGSKSDGASLSTSHVQTSSTDPHSAPWGENRGPGGQRNGEGGRQGAASAATEDRVMMKTPRTAESVKLSIQTQAESLNDRLDQFRTLMDNGQLTIDEQEKAFENIRTDHEKLRRAYLQAKEDYNVLRRSGATGDADFDHQKELEGHLFRLGMKFDEVHERVDSNVKLQTSQRQPFQTSRLAQDSDEDGDEVDGESSEQDGQPVRAAGDQEESEYEKRAGQLHEEYRALMDRYRRLKQMAPTPELERERDNLVRKLNEICMEMPDMFRLPPELQDRWDRLQRRDLRRSPLPSGSGMEQGAGSGYRGGPPSFPVPSSPKVHGLPMVGDHSISPYMSGHHGGRADSSFRRTPNSLSGSRSNLASPTGAMQSPPPQDRDGLASLSSLDGAAAPRDYDPRIARPRRHQHDFRDPKLSKMPDRGSYSSLPDSGISDQDFPRDHRPPDDALAHLPGPGTLKQLTHQRGDNDLDSGFLGSVVSADGAHSPARHRLPETPLRLRDRNENRARADSCDSTSTVGSQRQDSGRTGPQRCQRPTQPPPLVPALVGINRSMDRSYDGELDESTLSETQASGLRGTGSKLASSQEVSTTSSKRAPLSRRKGEEVSIQSQSLRSQPQSLRSQAQSRSMREDETLEDVSDVEMSESTTPQAAQQREHDLRGPGISQPSPRMYRPPTPHQPATPQRPPTPYRSEEREEEGGGRRGSQQEAAMMRASRMRGQRPEEDQVLLNTSQQRRSRSPAGPPSRTPHSQRPESRGAPTTDLYHTRPRNEQLRERSHAGEMSVQSARPGSRQGGPMRGEERGVGSDVEVHSNATQESSVNSARLRALQDEIEKLKEGVRQAHEKAAQRPLPPQQPPPPPQPEEPQYYDPFEDPYGFMRVPRRRANSFSGGRVREYDDWYMQMPGEKRMDDGDIPLGYAAADSYNRRPRDKTPDAAHQRLRHRGDRRRGQETVPKTVDEGGMNEPDMAGGAGVRTVNSASPARRSVQILRPPTTDPQALYNYYIPSRQGGQPPVANANPYRQHTTPLSASQPNLAGTLAGVEPGGYPQQSQAKRPWYTIRRAQWPAASSSGQYFPTLGHQTRSVTQPLAVTPSPPQPQTTVYYPCSHPASHNGVGYRVEACPLCGGAGAHIHEEDVEPVHGYVAQDFATNPRMYWYHKYRRHETQGRSRPRSRSASRTRHYTPERSSSHSRYLVREFGESISEDSDLEPGRGRRRSRSLSRTRSHSETRSSSGRSSSRQRGRRYRRTVEGYDSEEDIDLNESLGLSEDINRLTQRMLGTVKGELRRHRDRKEFGSSYW